MIRRHESHYQCRTPVTGFNFSPLQGRALPPLALVVLLLLAIAFSVDSSCASDSTPPYTVIPEPPDLPRGNGNMPLPINPGDGGVPEPPATGVADPTHGNIFGTRPAPLARIPSLYDSYGRNATEHGESLSTGSRPSEHHELPGAVQDQQINYPYPVKVREAGVIWSNGTVADKIMTDHPSTGLDDNNRPTLRHPNNEGWQNEEALAPMPTVRKFCRYLVIAGAVVGCILMAFAGYSVVLGQQNAGQRVIATAGGLMLLFAAYTIYKIVMINAFRFAGNSQNDIIYHRAIEKIPRTAVSDPAHGL